MTENSPAKRALLAPEEIETLLHGLRCREEPSAGAPDCSGELALTIELGRASLDGEAALALAGGSIVPLNKMTSDPVDILANGDLIGTGEVVIVNDKLCVRVLEMLKSARPVELR